MKRVREEEEEQQQRQDEEEQAAPMAWSPTPNPGPAAAAMPSETAERRVITKYDAIDFMLSVKRTFDQAKYYEFLDIMRQSNSIGVSGIADRMKVLQRGYPVLKRGFNKFLPTQYELSLRDDD